jgi:hypothetical protein
VWLDILFGIKQTKTHITPLSTMLGKQQPKGEEPAKWQQEK